MVDNSISNSHVHEPRFLSHAGLLSTQGLHPRHLTFETSDRFQALFLRLFQVPEIVKKSMVGVSEWESLHPLNLGQPALIWGPDYLGVGVSLQKIRVTCAIEHQVGRLSCMRPTRAPSPASPEHHQEGSPGAEPGVTPKYCPGMPNPLQNPKTRGKRDNKQQNTCQPFPATATTLEGKWSLLLMFRIANPNRLASQEWGHQPAGPETGPATNSPPTTPSRRRDLFPGDSGRFGEAPSMPFLRRTALARSRCFSAS